MIVPTLSTYEGKIAAAMAALGAISLVVALSLWVAPSLQSKKLISCFQPMIFAHSCIDSILSLQDEEHTPLLPSAVSARNKGPGQMISSSVEASARKGWTIQGRVFDYHDSIVPGATVSFQFHNSRGACFDFIKAVQADWFGYYKIVIPVLEPMRSYSPEEPFPFYLYASVAAPGFYFKDQGSQIIPHFSHANQTIELDLNVDVNLDLNRGPSLFGKVITPEGKRVQDADVYFARPEHKHFIDTTTSDDGSYQIDFEEVGNYTLYADKKNIGIASPISVSLNSLYPTEAPDLILEDRSFLEGVVLDPENKPVQGVVICAYPQRLKHVLSGDLREYVWTLEEDREVDLKTGTTIGSSSGCCHTGLEGRFKIGGLLPGNYFLADHITDKLLEETGKTNSNTGVIPRKIYTTGTRNIRVKAPLYTLKIRCFDEQGFIVPKVDLLLNGPGVHWPQRDHESNAYIAQAVPGPVQIIAKTRSGRNGKRRINVTKNQYLKEVDMLLELPIHPETIRLCLSGPEGKAIYPTTGIYIVPDGYAEKNIMVHQLSDLARTKEGDFLIETMPDTYDLHLFSDRTNVYLPATLHDLVVKPHQETRVKMSLAQGGRFSFNLLTDREDELEAGSIRFNPGHKKPYNWCRYAYLISDHRAEVIIDRELEPLKDVKVGIPYFPDSLLRPGINALEIRMKGFEPIPDTIIISPGQITNMSYWLKPEKTKNNR